jgi:hypothetical protein
LKVYDGVGREYIISNRNNYIVLDETDSDVDKNADCEVIFSD